MADSQVLKNNTEALFHIFGLQSLLCGRKGRGEWGSGNRTVSSINCPNSSGAPSTPKAIDYLLGAGFLCDHSNAHFHHHCSDMQLHLPLLPNLEADHQENALCHFVIAGHAKFTKPLTFLIQHCTGLARTGTFPNTSWSPLCSSSLLTVAFCSQMKECPAPQESRVCWEA